MTGCPLLDSEYAARQNGKRLPCERLAEENERLRELCHDTLAVIIGWSWKLNELAGYRLNDDGTYPSMVIRGFIDRARELDVPL